MVTHKWLKYLYTDQFFFIFQIFGLSPQAHCLHYDTAWFKLATITEPT